MGEKEQILADIFVHRVHEIEELEEQIPQQTLFSHQWYTIEWLQQLMLLLHKF